LRPRRELTCYIVEEKLVSSLQVSKYVSKSREDPLAQYQKVISPSTWTKS
jgi:hypothetical protein